MLQGLLQATIGCNDILQLALHIAIALMVDKLQCKLRFLVVTGKVSCKAVAWCVRSPGTTYPKIPLKLSNSGQWHFKGIATHHKRDIMSRWQTIDKNGGAMKPLLHLRNKGIKAERYTLCNLEYGVGEVIALAENIQAVTCPSCKVRQEQDDAYWELVTRQAREGNCYEDIVENNRKMHKGHTATCLCCRNFQTMCIGVGVYKIWCEQDWPPFDAPPTGDYIEDMNVKAQECSDFEAMVGNSRHYGK
jgi:hypothetical protein